MNRKFAIYLFFAFCFLLFTQVEARENRFIYDSMGKRDPLIPLVDKESITGLRTVFTSIKKRIRLPVKMKISGILRKGSEYFAIINGKAVKAGAILGPVKIKQIKKDEVIVEYGQRDFTLPLKGRR